MEELIIRPIRPEDNAPMPAIIRNILNETDLPATVSAIQSIGPVQESKIGIQIWSRATKRNGPSFIPGMDVIIAEITKNS